jgi:opacity protein-like surface antigen
VGKNTYKVNNVDSVFTDIGFNYRNNYVTIPISLKLRTNEIGYFTYYGVFGLSNSILTSAKAKISDGPSFYNKEEFQFVNKDEDAEVISSATIEDNVRVFRFGLLLEAGTEYSISGSTALVLGIQYNNNLGGVLRSNDLSASNSFVSLRVGVMF